MSTMEIPEAIRAQLAKLSPADNLTCEMVSRLARQVGGERGHRLAVDLVEYALRFVRGERPDCSLDFQVAIWVVTRFICFRAPLFLSADLLAAWEAAGKLDPVCCTFCGCLHPRGFTACVMCGFPVGDNLGAHLLSLKQSIGDMEKAVAAQAKMAAHVSGPVQ